MNILLRCLKEHEFVQKLSKYINICGHFLVGVNKYWDGNVNCQTCPFLFGYSSSGGAKVKFFQTVYCQLQLIWFLMEWKKVIKHILLV